MENCLIVNCREQLIWKVITECQVLVNIVGGFQFYKIRHHSITLCSWLPNENKYSPQNICSLMFGIAPGNNKTHSLCLSFRSLYEDFYAISPQLWCGSYELRRLPSSGMCQCVGLAKTEALENVSPTSSGQKKFVSKEQHSSWLAEWTLDRKTKDRLHDMIGGGAV